MTEHPAGDSTAGMADFPGSPAVPAPPPTLGQAQWAASRLAGQEQLTNTVVSEVDPVRYVDYDCAGGWFPWASNFKVTNCLFVLPGRPWSLPKTNSSIEKLQIRDS